MTIIIWDITFFQCVLLGLFFVHVFVSSVNIHPLLHIKHCAKGKNLDECDPASAWETLRVGKRWVPVTRPNVYTCPTWGRW